MNEQRFPISMSELDSLRYRLREANELLEPLVEENSRLTARIAELERQLAQRTGKVQRVAHSQLDAMLQTPQYDPLWA